MISSSHRHLPDNTQHSQQRNVHDLGGFRNQNSAGERAQVYALDRADTGTGLFLLEDQNNIPQFSANVTDTFNSKDKGTFASRSSIIPCSRHVFYTLSLYWNILSPGPLLYLHYFCGPSCLMLWKTFLLSVLHSHRTVEICSVLLTTLSLSLAATLQPE